MLFTVNGSTMTDLVHLCIQYWWWWLLLFTHDTKIFLHINLYTYLRMFLLYIFIDRHFIYVSKLYTQEKNMQWAAVSMLFKSTENGKK